MRSSSEKPHSKHVHVYAILRFDLDVCPSNVEHCATVVKVFSSREAAEQEASRLREINEGKDSTYIVQTTRFIGAPHTAES